MYRGRMLVKTTGTGDTIALLARTMSERKSTYHGVSMKINKRLIHLIFWACIILPLRMPGQKSVRFEEDMDVLRNFQLTLPVANMGLELVAAGEWDDAEKKFDECLKILPDHPYACYGKAVSRNRQKDLSGALDWIERAERGCLSLQRVWVNQKTNVINMSREEKQRLNALASQGIDYRQNSSFCDNKQLLVKNSTARATKDAFSGMKSGSSPFEIPAEFFSMHGNILFKLRRLEEAAEQYLKALDVNPAHERCFNNLLNIYYITRRLDRAREWLKKASRRNVKVNHKLEQAIRLAR